MCGIIGYLHKRERHEQPIGRVMSSMLQALSCRGPDSSGLAVYSSSTESNLVVALPANVDEKTVVAALNPLGVAPYRHHNNGVYFCCVRSGVDLTRVDECVDRSLPGSEVLCVGRSLILVKQVGSPDQLEVTYGVSEWAGTHGIGHTRLSTESRVDLSHSQPFWAHGVPDLATVHNGHITNYHKLRRQYEQRGYKFYTENDSEIIGVYLRDRLAAGLSIPDALRSSLDDFDGSFSYLAAWSDGLAYVRDRFGYKPLVIAETQEFVAIATEEIALRRALGRDFVAREPAPGTLMTWSVPAIQTVCG